jgi:hypothetical protein
MADFITCDNADITNSQLLRRLLVVDEDTGGIFWRVQYADDGADYSAVISCAFHPEMFALLRQSIVDIDGEPAIKIRRR